MEPGQTLVRFARRATASSADECFHGQRSIGKGPEDGLIGGHERHGQRARQRDEFGIMGSQRASLDDVEHELIGDDVLTSGERLISGIHYPDDLIA